MSGDAASTDGDPEATGELPADPADTWVDPPAHSDVRAIARPRSKEPECLVGDLIASRYELLRILGSGSTGSVYEAMDAHRATRVAIKLLHSHLRTSDGHVARFAREVRAATAIAHSSVVRVLDAGEDSDGTLFLVMELLEGEVLTDRMHDGLSMRETVEIGRQLLGALAAAHARGIVHRDIKPDNLFLARSDSGSIHLKVMDFGIAKLVRPEMTLSFQTLDGLILGTPAYMSPEICRGLPVTESADLWGAAAVLFEAFTNAPPFEEEHIGRLLLKVVRGRAPSLREKRPDLPAAIIEAIDRALDPNPALRWQSADEFATALSSGTVPIADLDWDDL